MQYTCMLLSELIQEHKRLIRVLKSGKGITEETKRQEKELREYISKINKRHKSDNSMFGDLPGWENKHL